MLTSTVEYLGELRTEATHLLSGNKIVTDAPPDNQGRGEAFSPTDLCATALASCMLTIMGINARKNQIDMTGARAEVTKIMASDPRRIGRIELTIFMPPKNYTDAEKALLETAGRNCPVHFNLYQGLEEVVNFVW